MRPYLMALAVAVQVAVGGSMVWQREAILHTGQRVWLQTMPVDPQDAMRGDYVRLTYDLSSVPHDRCRDGLANLATVERDDVVYAVLTVGDGDKARLDYLTDKRPTSGLYLRGRVEYNYGDAAVNVRYGLEALFVQEGRGIAIENLRSQNGAQVPLEVQVAVGDNGIAVLDGWRSGGLGIGLTLAPGHPGDSPVVTVRLVNCSNAPIAIVDRPDGHSFSLEPAADWRADRDTRWHLAGQPLPPPTAVDIKLLAPGEACTHTIDLNLPSPGLYVAVWVTPLNNLPRRMDCYRYRLSFTRHTFRHAITAAACRERSGWRIFEPQ